MRHITHLVVHCSATRKSATVEAIQTYWRTPKANAQTGATSPYIPNVQGGLGWINPGYHVIINPWGRVWELLPIEQVSNGVGGHNSNIINICYIGGVDDKGKPDDNRTKSQKLQLESYLRKWKHMFPRAQICGHRDFLTPGTSNWKDCPSFNAKAEYAWIGNS